MKICIDETIMENLTMSEVEEIVQLTKKYGTKNRRTPTVYRIRNVFFKVIYTEVGNINIKTLEVIE